MAWVTTSSNAFDSRPSKTAVTGTYQWRGSGNRRAFYGIFLGHEHRPFIVERNVLDPQSRVVGQGGGP